MPGNILVEDKKGTLGLIDFGQAPRPNNNIHNDDHNNECYYLLNGFDNNNNE